MFVCPACKTRPLPWRTGVVCKCALFRYETRYVGEPSLEGWVLGCVRVRSDNVLMRRDRLGQWHTVPGWERESVVASEIEACVRQFRNLEVERVMEL